MDVYNLVTLLFPFHNNKTKTNVEKFVKMTFDNYKELIEENDTVILYISFNTMYALKVTPTKLTKNGDSVENIFQTSYGGFKVNELVGKKFGTKVQMSRGYGYVLYPTPELWTKTLPHRTQILYATDISLILLQLELKPGTHFQSYKKSRFTKLLHLR
jgi:tRNA (adenine57-N1/adenine58-N1)-methyltransferase